jgi:hypothetical protein
MVNYNASKNNQWLLNWFKTQVITIRNNESTIILEICKKGRHFSTYFDNILYIITKYKNIVELQGFLKHNDFAKKSTKFFLMQCKIFNYNKLIRNKKDNSYGKKM